MADIRINALTTTATSSASDDYIAIDGTANGTRKLSVYTPTFGGLVTSSQPSTTNNTTATGFSFSSGTDATNGPLSFSFGSYFSTTGSSRFGYIVCGDNNAIRTLYLNNNGAGVSGTVVVGNSGGNLGVGTSSPFSKLNVQADGSTTDVGQFVICGATNTSKRFSFGFNTTSDYATIQALIAGVGYYPLAVQPNGGNLLVGTTTDAGFKLQVSGSALIDKASVPLLEFRESGVTKGQLYTSSGEVVLSSNTAKSVIFQTNGVNALVLDSSQNATFAGRIGLTASGTSTIYSNFIPADSGTFAGNITMQAGGGSGAFGGGLSLYGPSHATKPGWVSIGMSATTGAKFAVNDSGLSGGTDLFTIDRNANQFIKNSSVVPGSNPSGGGYLYVDAGALKYRGSSGTVTTIAVA